MPATAVWAGCTENHCEYPFQYLANRTAQVTGHFVVTAYFITKFSFVPDSNESLRWNLHRVNSEAKALHKFHGHGVHRSRSGPREVSTARFFQLLDCSGEVDFLLELVGHQPGVILKTVSRVTSSTITTWARSCPNSCAADG